MKWTNEQKTVIDLAGMQHSRVSGGRFRKDGGADRTHRVPGDRSGQSGEHRRICHCNIYETCGGADERKTAGGTRKEIGGRPGKCTFAASGHASSCHTDFYNT